MVVANWARFDTEPALNPEAGPWELLSCSVGLSACIAGEDEAWARFDLEPALNPAADGGQPPWELGGMLAVVVAIWARFDREPALNPEAGGWELMSCSNCMSCTAANEAKSLGKVRQGTGLEPRDEVTAGARSTGASERCCGVGLDRREKHPTNICTSYPTCTILSKQRSAAL